MKVRYEHYDQEIEYKWVPDDPDSVECLGCEIDPAHPEGAAVCKKCDGCGIWIEK